VETENLENLLIVFVVLSAVAFIFQCVFIALTLRSVKNLSERVSHVSKDLEKDARDLMAQLQEVISSLQNLSSISEKLLARSDHLGQLFEKRSQDLDDLTETFIRIGNKQADNIDEVVSSTIEKFEQTTGVIQRDILQPIVEISSLVKGLKTAIDYLFARRSSRSGNEDYSDEDLFI
jgi:uncharacterized protein YoxC